MNSIDCIVTTAAFKGLDILGSKSTVSSWIHVLEAGKVRKQKDLCDFDKNQIVMSQEHLQNGHGANFDSKKPQI